MVIYKATNKVNGKSYVGQTINKFNDRKLNHLRNSKNNSNNYFHNAINKYGQENFKWEVICECKDIDELNEKEQYYIKENNSFVDNGCGYNMTLGGENYIRSNITKKRMSKPKSAETKKKMSDYQSGRRKSDGYKNSISNTVKKRWKEGKCHNNNTTYHSGENHHWYGVDRTGDNNGMYGKYQSMETKIKIGEKAKRKIECPHCTLIGSISNMKRWHFDNCKELIYGN